VPLPTVPHLWRVSLDFQVATLTHANVVLDVLSPGGTATAQEVVEGVTTAWCDTGSIWSVQSDSVVFEGAIVTPFDNASAGIPFGAEVWPEATGQVDTPPVPPQCAWVITKQTGLAGRSRRGRMYVPGVAESFLNSLNQQWTPGDATTFQEAATAFLVSLPGTVAGTELQVYSEVEEGVAEVTFLRSNIGYIGTQRRRAKR
jgi:hypothetical protein